ncbi:MAG TPA: type IV pili twitching motility protein PilT, partial [Patescibacteria group bacterium]
MDIKELLLLTIKNRASDLHLLVGLPPTFRIDGVLRPLGASPALKPEDVENMIYALLTPEQKELLIANKELDFSFGIGQGAEEEGRFRINAYFQKGYLSAALRFL